MAAGGGAVSRVAVVQDAWWEVLPEQAQQLPAELGRVDAFVDDERFIAPWRAMFPERPGRPSVPVETLLRLLYLKHRYQLGYETLCREVADSLSWRRLCRIPLSSPEPHPTRRGTRPRRTSHPGCHGPCAVRAASPRPAL